MKDYTASSRVFTPQGVVEGDAGLRGFFEGMIPLIKELGPNMKIEAQEVRDDVAYIVWSAGAAAPLGTDTFIVRDGKIVAQTFAAYMPG